MVSRLLAERYSDGQLAEIPDPDEGDRPGRGLENGFLKPFKGAFDFSADRTLRENQNARVLQSKVSFSPAVGTFVPIRCAASSRLFVVDP